MAALTPATTTSAPCFLAGVGESSSFVVGLKKFNVSDSSSSKLAPLPENALPSSKQDFAELRQKLQRDGFLLVRQVIPQEVILEARKTMLQLIDKKKGLMPGKPLMQAVIAKAQPAGDHDKENQSGNSSNKKTASSMAMTTMMMTMKPADKKVASHVTPDGLVAGWTVDAESGGCTYERDNDVPGWRKVGNSRALKSVYDGTQFKQFLHNLFAGKEIANCPQFTWLRARSKGDITVEHADIYYFKGNTDLFSANTDLVDQPSEPTQTCQACQLDEPANGGLSKAKSAMHHCVRCMDSYHQGCMRGQKWNSKKGEWICNGCIDHELGYYTCWIPLGDISFEHGTLALVPGSHNLTGYNAPYPGRELPGEYKKTERDSRWQLSEMRAGDLIIFNIKTVHAASKNLTSTFRMSLDTRLVVKEHKLADIREKIADDKTTAKKAEARDLPAQAPSAKRTKKHH